MPSRFYFVNLAPLFSVRDATFIGITTPTSSDNFVSVLIKIRLPNGESPIIVKKIGLVCKRCEGTDREQDCTHPVPNRPHWKDEDAEEQLRVLYGERKTEYAQEMMGLITEGENRVFPEEFLRTFFEGDRCREPHVFARTVYVAVDPNGGHTSDTGSDTSVVSFFYDGPRIVVVGFERWPTANVDEIVWLVTRHMQQLRSTPCFRDSQFVLVPEDNLASEAQTLSERVMSTMPCHVLCSDKNRYGVKTKPGMKALYVKRVQTKLQDRCFVYHETLVVANPFSKKFSAEETSATKLDFERQLTKFRKVVILPTRPDERARIIYSGRMNEEGKVSAYMKDDMCMAFLIGIFHTGRARDEHGREQERVYKLRGTGSRLITFEELEQTST